MLPVVLVVLGGDGHVLVDLDQVSASVEVGSSQHKAEKLGQSGMKSSNVANIVDVVLVDALILQNRLVEICNHELDDSVATNQLEVIFATHSQKN